jgi:hypothetical protein
MNLSRVLEILREKKKLEYGRITTVGQVIEDILDEIDKEITQ